MTKSSLKQTTLNALANSFTPASALALGKKNAAAAAEANTKKGIKRKTGKRGLQIIQPLQASVSKQKTPSPPKPPFQPQRQLTKQRKSSSSEEDAKPLNPRQPPSLSSGGIPSPSTRYLAQSLAPPTQLPQPRRILVILDLNGTLLYRPSRRRPSHFVERPHARSFLKYCLDTFHLAIWSSARPDNVNSMVAQLLAPDECARCVVVWARDRLGLSPEDYDARVQVYKRLSTVWDDPRVRASHPDAARGACWDQSNTVLVDDSREKGRSEPYNILPVPEFSGLQGESPNVLPQVHDYLNALCFQADVSRYMRENPFRLDSGYTLPEAF
ncbi:phosphoprotein phosphatase [Metarhizium acridum CQMa 102]|uniref:Mitochondrial import inner membrane translocase subunit TIM50 n=1 Tax=Metarhizium acridum (strain CQMa 102) TaxID=655827 RepID=E9DS58_METAQ|nr:phosphoprotein phosphatase [Metarhizium acridum CQMa 102]EFY93218.1 phosphoprotein phosphatase [Metarhizium acridum CQMa 102]